MASTRKRPQPVECHQYNGTFYGYARVSSGEQVREGFSLAAQCDRLQVEYDYLRRQNPTLRWGGVFVEKGESAWSKDLADRTEGRRLSSTLMPGDIVCVVHFDRAFRQISDWGRTCQSWNARRVAFRIAGGEFDSSTAIGKMALNVVCTFAQFESDIRSERTRAAKNAKKRRTIPKNHVPGRKCHSLTGQKLPAAVRNAFANKHEQAISRYMLHLRRKGLSWSKVGLRVHELMCKRKGIPFTYKQTREWNWLYCVRSIRDRVAYAEAVWPVGIGGWGAFIIPDDLKGRAPEANRRAVLEAAGHPLGGHAVAGQR